MIHYKLTLKDGIKRSDTIQTPITIHLREVPRSRAENRGKSCLPPFKDINTTATDNAHEEVEASAPEMGEPNLVVVEKPITAKESAVRPGEMLDKTSFTGGIRDCCQELGGFHCFGLP